MRNSVTGIARLSRSSLLQPRHRFQSTLSSAVYTEGSSKDAATTTTSSTLTPSQREHLSQMLRVDHSGEIAANTIYLAQAKTFAFLGDEKTSKMMMDMLETEKKHLKVTEKLLQQHRVRPSMLAPVWGIAGSVLGIATALVGKEGAMAATEAVETVIGEHYDDQLTALRTMSRTQDSSQPPHPSMPLLENIITEFRDDELEHLDTAVEHDAQQAPGHALMTAIIGFGCKRAISIARRI